jgi:hypothetical protein
MDGDHQDAVPLPIHDNTTQKDADSHPWFEWVDWFCVVRLTSQNCGIYGPFGSSPGDFDVDHGMVVSTGANS